MNKLFLRIFSLIIGMSIAHAPLVDAKLIDGIAPKAGIATTLVAGATLVYIDTKYPKKVLKTLSTEKQERIEIARNTALAFLVGGLGTTAFGMWRNWGTSDGAGKQAEPATVTPPTPPVEPTREPNLGTTPPSETPPTTPPEEPQVPGKKKKPTPGPDRSIEELKACLSNSRILPSRNNSVNHYSGSPEAQKMKLAGLKKFQDRFRHRNRIRDKAKLREMLSEQLQSALNENSRQGSLTAEQRHEEARAWVKNWMTFSTAENLLTRYDGSPLPGEKPLYLLKSKFDKDYKKAWDNLYNKKKVFSRIYPYYGPAQEEKAAAQEKRAQQDPEFAKLRAQLIETLVKTPKKAN